MLIFQPMIGDAASNDIALDHTVNGFGNEVQIIADNVARRLKAYAGTGPKARRVRALAKGLIKLLGGEPVAVHDCLEACMIGSPDAGYPRPQYWCSGTLIHPRAVLTAAHCVCAKSGVLVPDGVTIGAEAPDRATDDMIYGIERIETHPSLDVALVILYVDADVAPVARASQEEIARAHSLTLVNFRNPGSFGGSGLGTKRQAEALVDCIRRAAGEDLLLQERLYGFRSHFEFTALADGGAIDSGGAAYVMVDGQRKLAGIASRPVGARSAAHTVGSGGADVMAEGGHIYVRADAIGSWIEQKLATLVPARGFEPLA